MGAVSSCPATSDSLDALLEVAGQASHGRAQTEGFPWDGVRIAILPTAASRGSPDRVAAHAVTAFKERAMACGHPVRIGVARVVDASSADDPDVAEVIASADLAYLPGGDPDIVPGLLAGSSAGRALTALHGRGAVIAGASAGAMALADWSWTPEGGIRGLGFVHGLIVVPHYDDVRRMAWQTGLEKVAPRGLGYLGLDERTGVIAVDGGWRVAGEGAAYWFRSGSSFPMIARHGDVLELAS